MFGVSTRHHNGKTTLGIRRALLLRSATQAVVKGLVSKHGWYYACNVWFREQLSELSLRAESALEEQAERDAEAGDEEGRSEGGNRALNGISENASRGMCSICHRKRCDEHTTADFCIMGS